MAEMDLTLRAAARQRRWRRLSRAVSGSLGAAAIGGAVYLGVTGPVVSPVQVPAAAAAAAPAIEAPAGAPGPADEDPAVTHAGNARRGDRGTRGDHGHGSGSGGRR